MAPPKRKENVSANQRPAKAAKRANSSNKEEVACVSKAPEVVVPEEHKPVLALLDEAVQLDCVSTGSREMLKMALPTVFSKGEEGRHEFQNRIVELFDAVFRDSETKICDMVSAEKARLTDAEADKALAVAKSDGLRQSIATQEEELRGAAANLENAGTSTMESQQNLDSLSAKESAAQSDHADAVASAQKIHTLLHEHWPAVQSLDATDKTVNARRKEVQSFMAMFSAIDGLEESLIDGLSVALQTSSVARGSFAGQALEHGEQALKDHHEALVQEAGTRDTEMHAAADAVIAAKEQLKTADEHKHSCKEKLEEVTAYGTTLKKQLKDAVGLQKQDEHLVEEIQKDLAVLEAKLERFSSWLAQYQTLKSAPAPDSNMKSEEPAAVAEAEVSEEAVQQPQEVEMTN